MKKSYVSIFLAVAMMVSMLFGVMVVPALAANTATLTVSDTAGELGDIIEVSIAASADSYIVNGDFDLTYDPDVLRYVPDSCQASALLDDMYWAANNPIDGKVSISFASAASVGITAQGALFAMQFEIISKDTMQTMLSLDASPLRGCNGGEDFDVKPVIVGGQIGIVGGADPWNFLQEAFLESGHENVSIDDKGIWTVTGDFTLSPDFTMNYADWQYIAQKFTTNTPVKITLVDNDPLGVYGKHEIGLYDNFVGPTYYPAKAFDQVNSILGVYNWNITNAGWKNSGLATIDQVIVHFENSSGVSAQFTSLYMSQTPNTTVSMVRTTATKPTTTTKVYPLTYTVETVDHVGSVAAGESVTLDITVNEIDAVCGLSFVVNYDPQLFAVTDESVHSSFMGYISNTMPAGQFGFSLEAYPVGDTALAADTVVASITLTALKDIDSNTAVTIDNLEAFRFAPGIIECTAVNGGVNILEAVAGDVTGDADVDAGDVATLFYYINRAEDLDGALLGNADFNSDGIVNLYDVARLFYVVNELV